MLDGKWFKDAAERVALTFVEAFLGSILIAAASADKIDLSTAQSALIAAVVAGVAAVKTMIASFIGTKGTASLVDGIKTG